MLISLNWLQQYLPTIDQVDAVGVAQKLSASLAEVEQIINRGENLNNIVIGEVTGIEDHPKDQKMQVCQVKISNNETRQIIHGAAKKVKVGDKVPVCLPGGSILDPAKPFNAQPGVQIIEKEIKGINSQGVLCSLKELGLADEHKEVMILHPSSEPGEKLDYILKDKILEIENKSLTHRPDCFSHLGMAREIAALYNLSVERKNELSRTFLEKSSLKFEVEVKVKEKCPRFTAIVIKDTKVSPSPFWLQAILLYTGIRPVNNIVDISNYLMLDLGQPTHIFDYDKIEGKKIIVREAKDKEEITTIDGHKRTLSKGMVVLADKKQILGIPGIMGAKDSEVSDTTKNIVLVVENWEMYTLRRASRDLGLRTEASTRFEKGLDPTKLTDVLQIGADMLTDLSRSEIASEIIDIYPKPEQPLIFEFDLNSVYKILGIEITKEEIVNILKALEIKVVGDEKIEENVLARTDETNKINLEIPSHRRDLKIKEDIIEEIARIHGYQTLTPTLPTKDLTPVKSNPLKIKIKKIKTLMSRYGAHEIYSYTMIGNKLCAATGVDQSSLIRIKNPLSPELQYFRNSLLPSLIEKVELNAKNRFENFALYEFSRIAYKDRFEEKEGKDSSKSNKLPYQPYHLSIARYSSKETNRSGDLHNYKFIKGYLDLLLEDLGLKELVNVMKLKNGDRVLDLPNAWHPAQTGKILYKEESIGLIGNAHPKLYENFKINGHLSILEMEFSSEMMDKIKVDMNDYTAIVNMPAVYRDISFWMGQEIELGPLISALQKSDIKYFESIDLVDIYEDSKHPGKKSVTINITFRAKKKTLEEKDITDSVREATQILEQRYKAEIRK